MRVVDDRAIKEHASVRFRSEYHYAIFEYWRSAKVLGWLDRAGIRTFGRVLDDGCGGGGMGVVFAALELPPTVARQVCLYTAVRGVLAAAVKLGIARSYESQRIQYGLIPAIAAVADRARDFDESHLAQTAPVVDLLQAAHDRLYSRLFQS